MLKKLSFADDLLCASAKMLKLELPRWTDQKYKWSKYKI